MTTDTETETVARKASIVRYDDNKFVLRLGIEDAKRLFAVSCKSNASNPGAAGGSKIGLYRNFLTHMTDEERDDAKARFTMKGLNKAWELDCDFRPTEADWPLEMERHDEDHFQVKLCLRDTMRLQQLFGHSSSNNNGIFGSQFFEDISMTMENEEIDEASTIARSLPSGYVLEEKAA